MLIFHYIYAFRICPREGSGLISKQHPFWTNIVSSALNFDTPQVTAPTTLSVQMALNEKSTGCRYCSFISLRGRVSLGKNEKAPSAASPNNRVLSGSETYELFAQFTEPLGNQGC